MDCIFCSIIKGEITSSKVYEDDRILAFKDINPAAPVHIIIVPKTHISSTNELDESNCDIVGHIFAIGAKLAKEMGISDKGYRIVNNCGEEGGQTVNHLHFHLLGGRLLQWPPG